MLIGFKLFVFVTLQCLFAKRNLILLRPSNLQVNLFSHKNAAKQKVRKYILQSKDSKSDLVPTLLHTQLALN